MCLLGALVARAQSPAGTPLEVVAAGNGTLQLRFAPSVVPRLDGGVLRWEGLAFGTAAVGAPDLPSASTLVELPVGSVLQVESLAGEERSLTALPPLDHPLPPVAGPWIKDLPPPQARPDKALYAADSLLRGGPPVQVEPLGVMGNRTLYRLTVRPLAYNPQRGIIRYYPSLSATLRLKEGGATVERSGVPERMLIVSRPHYREGLQPFVRWKRQEGYDVLELYAATHRRDSIKALMRPFFDSASAARPAPRFILLVGDVSDLQAFVGSTHPTEMDDHITDLPYADFTGDRLPDALLGRWPVNDTAELRAVVDKTLAYEQGHSLDSAALRRVLLVAGHEEHAPAPTTTNGQVNYLGREIKQAMPEVDTLCFRNPASGNQAAAIASEIGQGVGLLNYTAHCTVGGWTSPAVSSGTLDTLPAHMPLVYVNNCCKSNDFGGTGFGEQLLRMQGGGAVGVIGATNNTLWNEDYYWAVGPKLPVSLDPVYADGLEGAFDRWVGRRADVQTLGALLQAGNLAVEAFGSPYSAFYWEIYCLLGDPSLRPYLGVPRRAAVALAGELSAGMSALSLSGTPGARVSLVQGDVMLGVAELDSAGHAALSLRQSLDTLPVVLTASGYGLVPSVDTLAVARSLGAAVALCSIETDHHEVRCAVSNLGMRRADSVTISLVQSAEDTLAGARVAVPPVAMDSLAVGQCLPVTLPVQVLSMGQHPWWQAWLVAEWAGGQREIRLVQPLDTVYPTMTLRLLNVGGGVARKVHPSQPYTLQAVVEGDYDSIRLEAAGQVSDSSTLHFTTADSLCRLHVLATLRKGGWADRREHWIVAGERLEGFEDGFRSHPWDTLCRVPWVLDSTVVHDGRYSVRSGAIGNDQTSDLDLKVVLMHDDTVSFWAKVSSEPQHDLLVFSIDGVRKEPVLWGELGWRQYRYPVPAGSHLLRWRYHKDPSTSRGSDCVWIDDVRLPMALWDVPAGWECVGDGVGVDSQPDCPPSLRVYPNPASKTVFLQAEAPVHVTVVDALGRHVAAFEVEPGIPHRWDVQPLPAGVYLLAATGSAQASYTKLIILND